MKALIKLACLIIFSFSISCENKYQSTEIDDEKIADESRTSDWLAYGRTHNERRFSPLEDINADNVSNLSVDWYLDLPNDVGLVSTPLVVDGVLYFTGTMNVLRAVNAVTGELLWEFDPEVGKHIDKTRQAGWAHSRGISFYEGKDFYRYLGWTFNCRRCKNRKGNLDGCYF